MASHRSWLRAGAVVLGVVLGIAAFLVARFTANNGALVVLLITLGLALLLYGLGYTLLSLIGITWRAPVRLGIELRAVDPEGSAKGRWAPWGGPPHYVYFYHVIVRNKGSEPAEKVRVEVTSARKPSEEGDNLLDYSLRLLRADRDQEADRDEEKATSVSISGYGKAEWNLGYLGNWDDPQYPVHHFQLDVFKWPRNFRPFVREKESMRVTVQPVAANARTKPSKIDIRWDGTWLDNDPENMKEHCEVRELRRRWWPCRGRGAARLARSTA